MKKKPDIKEVMSQLHKLQTQLVNVLIDDGVIAHPVIERMLSENLRNARLINEAYGLMAYQQKGE